MSLLRSVARASVFCLLIQAGLLCACRSAAPGANEVRGAPTPRIADERTEVVEDHWPDGSLRARTEVIARPDGSTIRHGMLTRWYRGGQKRYEARYVRDQLHGVEREWHRNGQLALEQHYVDGLRHGPRVEWDAAGNKRKEEHYRRNQPAGIWTVWTADGKIKWQGDFSEAPEDTSAEE